MKIKVFGGILMVVFVVGWLETALVGAETPEPTASPTPTPPASPSPTPTPKPALSPELEKEREELERKKEATRKEIEAAKQRLEELKKQGASLENEIAYQDSRIRLTTLQIEETLEKIAALKQQINDLSVKIKRLEKIAKDLETAAKSRITATYKSSVGGGNPLFLIFATRNFGDFVNRYKYYQVLQQHDKKLLKEIQFTRDNYDEQRQLKKEKQAQTEALENQLEVQKKLLSQQKKEKENLLRETRGEEKRYQEKLAALIADEKAIEEALNSILTRILEGLESGQSVSRGQIIGRQGNTGNVWPRPSGSCPECGSHLHFMVLTCGDWSCAVNPKPYLDRGEYARPLSTWYVTQGFGRATCSYCGYAYHNGLDMVYDGDGYGSSGHGAPIYAVADGELFYGTDSAGGKYAIIKHADDFYTAYWHLQ